jgi:hypothetical protein
MPHFIWRVKFRQDLKITLKWGFFTPGNLLKGIAFQLSRVYHQGHPKVGVWGVCGRHCRPQTPNIPISFPLPNQFSMNQHGYFQFTHLFMIILSGWLQKDFGKLRFFLCVPSFSSWWIFLSTE